MRWILALLVSCSHATGTSSSQPADPTTATEESEVPAEAPVEAAASRPAPAKAAPAPKGDAPSDPFARAFLEAHNAARAKNCAPPLTWSPKIAQVAQAWANQLKAKGCVFGHSGNEKYGENLGAGTIGALDPQSTVDMWYDEIKIYKFPDGGFSMKTGHFTQLVWQDTRQVGCGHVQCKGNDIYVCNYDPPGNWEGQYRQEVLPPSCKKK